MDGLACECSWCVCVCVNEYAYTTSSVVLVCLNISPEMLSAEPALNANLYNVTVYSQCNVQYEYLLAMNITMWSRV